MDLEVENEWWELLLVFQNQVRKGGQFSFRNGVKMCLQREE